MSYLLEHSQVLLGNESDLDKALALDKLPTKTSYSSLEDGQQVVSSFFPFSDEVPTSTGGNKLERIELLLSQLLAKVARENRDNDVSPYSQMPVFWLLPELLHQPLPGQDNPGGEKQYLQVWAARLKKAFPALFNHELSQFFPFGRAALPMALTSVVKLLSANDIEIKEKKGVKDQVPGVCLIAVDSLYHDLDILARGKLLITAESDSGIVPSEGAIFTCIKPANQQEKQGISIDLLAQESTSINQRSSGIESLFLKVSQDLAGQEEKITHLYLPGNGDETLSHPWSDAYFRLAPCLEGRARIFQSALFTGELGCVTGLYNLLHLYNGFEQQELLGKVVQLEQSQSLYQAIALYSWQGEVETGC
ncbi:hypothetical protein [Thalassomonas haliotis]|uniref:Uncharacterized protein n=1 Tax=Thalassomonas haliotis TaxID=485448 RepID=A0ABY7VLT0_9GAMM|nr:hypothetical protein [Thalassomonas haliotis]WDE13898.1 hypothetical protein H3N35_10895 [Thalassomonas haliotis]